MWDQCGIARTIQGLQQGESTVANWNESLEKAMHGKGNIPLNLLECRNRLQSADLILKAAMHRHESRGLHYLTDYPEKKESLRKHFRIR
jgi:L-aspartate oxidase